MSDDEKDRRFFMMCMAAPRGSGKSYCTKTLLGTLFKSAFDVFIVICPSLQVNQDYDEFRSDSRFKFYPHITEKELDKIFDRLYTIKSDMVRNLRSMKSPKQRPPRVLVIFDDCIDSGMLNFRGPVDKFAQRGRHVNMSVMVLSQGIASISLPVRRNSDYFIIFRPFNFTETERFLDEFIPKKDKKFATQRMIEIFDTEYQFLIVDNTDTSVHGRLKVSDAVSFSQGITQPFFTNKE